MSGADPPPGGSPCAHAPGFHVWTSAHYPLPLPPGHPFPAFKHRALLDRLVAEGICAPEHLHASEVAPLEWALRVHDPHYVKRVLEGGLDAAEQRVLGMPWSPELVRRARAALFGTVMAARAAAARGVAANLAGGSHHAFRDRGEAYCVLNDLAVAIALLRDDERALRPIVIDLDVHQGNGTAAIFAGDPSVFTYSIHACGNYPKRREESSLDVELPDGSGDEEFLNALTRTLPEALERHRPDFALVQAGVDALACDRFGKLAMTHAGLAERDARVFRWCEEHALPVVVTLGGGYGQPIEASIEAHVAVWRAARAACERRARRNQPREPR